LISSETPSEECSGILENLGIEEIDFMDTGSEGSFTEAFSATNTAIPNLINSKENFESKLCFHNPVLNIYKGSHSIKEVAGIDYIEQGACILESIVKTQENDYKTPVNETALPVFGFQESR